MSQQQIENIYPLTALQQGILFHSISQPASGVFIDQIHFDLHIADGDVADYKRSWEYLTARHDALRTAFIWKALKQPVQVVKTKCELDWQAHDFSTLSDSDQRVRFAELLIKDRCRDFDLARAPLSRHHLIRMNGGCYRILWTFHHLILDGWSVANLFSELKTVFGVITHGRQPEFSTPRPFSDFIEFSQKKQTGGDQAFWKNYLKDYLQPAGFPAAMQSTSKDMALSEQDIQCSADENQVIVEFARKHRLSMNTLVHAAWSLLLMTYSGQDDVVYGATFSGRDPQMQDIERMIGVFINTLPVRITRHCGQGVVQWLQTIQTNLNRLKGYEHSALNTIKRCSDVDAQTKLFETLLVVENYPNDSSGETQSLELLNVTHVEQSNYPIVLLMLPGSPLKFRLIYDSNLYSAQQVKSVLEQLRHCMLSLCESADKTLNDIEVIPDRQKTNILEMSLDDSYSFDFAASLHETIHSFSQSDEIALTGPGGTLTYRELNSMADLIAREISKFSAHPGRPDRADANMRVAICLNRQQGVVESMLGVLKSGAAYVIIDPDMPSARLDYLLGDCQPEVCITSSDAGFVNEHKQLNCIFIDKICKNSNTGKLPLLHPAQVAGDSLAYILYTSGSTGRPKGVKISHANLAYSTRVRTHCYASDPRVFLLLSPFVFDSSVAGIFWTLTKAGRLIISEPRLEQNMQKLTDQIHHYQVSHTLCLPSIYELILKFSASAGSVDRLQSLQTVILAGEALASAALLRLHRKLLPNTSLYNEYGPTEATVWSSFYDASRHPHNLPVPIGKAIPGTRMLILDRSNRILPLNVPGEICIAGPGVSQGYLNAEALTRRQFVEIQTGPGHSHPVYRRYYKTGDIGVMDENGVITFLGREDDQIKIRGQRLETAEIEAALMANPVIDQAATLVIDDARGEISEDANASSEMALDAWLDDTLSGMQAGDAQELLERARKQASQAVEGAK